MDICMHSIERETKQVRYIKLWYILHIPETSGWKNSPSLQVSVRKSSKQNIGHCQTVLVTISASIF